MKKLKIDPILDQVLVVRDEAETKSPGGIVIPDAAKKKTQSGVVAAAGPGGRTPDGKTVPMDPRIKPGNRVWFARYSGAELEYENLKFIILREPEIVAVEK